MSGPTGRPAKIIVILNPAAGRGRGARLRPKIHDLLSAAADPSDCFAPIDWEIRETSCVDDGRRLASDAASAGATLVVAAGGDGTLNEVVNGIVGTHSALGLIPIGTGNDFARNLGLTEGLDQAIDTLLNGTEAPIDLGRVHDRWFINVAGCGFDAVVADRVNRGYRRLHGSAAYIAAVLQSLISLAPTRMYITCDTRFYEIRGLMCAVANAPMYGGGMRIAPDARIDDGLLDLCVLGDAGRLEFIRAFPRVFRGTHTDHRRVTMDRARTVTIDSDRPLPLLIDGEISGTTPAIFTVVPGAISMRIPRSYVPHTRDTF